MEEEFPTLIGELLARVGATELYRRTRVGVQTWRDWAKGSPPSMRQILQAADALGIRPAQLLCYEPLPYRFVDKLVSGELPRDRSEEVRRIRYELRALDQRRAVLEADLDRLLESDPNNPDPPTEDAA